MEDKQMEQKRWRGYQTGHLDRYQILKDYAHENRKKSTIPELIMWEHLRGKQQGAKFRRQHPIGDYIADFVCLDCRLVVEIDGGYHLTEEQQEDDIIREKAMERLGFETLRFSNDDVMNNLEMVLGKIRERIPTPDPSPGGEGSSFAERRKRTRERTKRENTRNSNIVEYLT